MIVAQDLARAYPTEITVLNKFAFFWPMVGARAGARWNE
jgi:hypothetical protein